ncbi:hypothetical protein CEXT_292471 [Caerostris extrusa]|uniref:Uncharacterized protein n=1 Tax=Caerostris extrusa TaxID=172846 RepID=A0AAV4W7D4_CAEEX|nr:hypothetical protein CEXT_292471 [Caerostris extrusa]
MVLTVSLGFMVHFRLICVFLSFQSKSKLSKSAFELSKSSHTRVLYCFHWDTLHWGIVSIEFIALIASYIRTVFPLDSLHFALGHCFQFDSLCLERISPRYLRIETVYWDWCKYETVL